MFSVIVNSGVDGISENSADCPAIPPILASRFLLSSQTVKLSRNIHRVNLLLDFIFA